MISAYTKRSFLLAVVVVAIAVAMISCRNQAKVEAGTLAKVGAETFTVDDLRAAMPAGLAPDDSARLASAIVREWTENKLLNAAARRNITDMDRIDRMVEQYRSDLILHEYMRLMFEQKASAVYHPDSIAAYYEANSDKFKLQRPVVKGIYLKVADNAPALQKMARWSQSQQTADLDHLEQTASRQATHYDYFRDRWVDWEQIENKVPYDFGDNPNAFLQGRKHLETSVDGFTYILDITDFIPAGQPMPLEFAAPAIREALANARRAAFDATLRRQMLLEALESGTAAIDAGVSIP